VPRGRGSIEQWNRKSRRKLKNSTQNMCTTWFGLGKGIWINGIRKGHVASAYSSPFSFLFMNACMDRAVMTMTKIFFAFRSSKCGCVFVIYNMGKREEGGI
jgi:hypothetical protein